MARARRVGSPHWRVVLLAAWVVGAHEFDCREGQESPRSGWSSRQKEWCCSHRAAGCDGAPDDAPAPARQAAAPARGGEGAAVEALVTYDCEAGYWNWKEEWSERKRTFCCKLRGRACTASSRASSSTTPATPRPTSAPSSTSTATLTPLPYDCRVGYRGWKDLWSPKKRRWCCRHRGLACPEETTTQTTTRSATATSITLTSTTTTATETTLYDCQDELWAAGTLWSAAKREWCCRHRGRGCPAAARAPSGAGAAAAVAAPGAACSEAGVVYEPLDMAGQRLSVEVDAAACQARCANVSGCLHFSFWGPGRHCHLQSMLSMPQGGMPGFVSGPRSCARQEAARCFEIGTSYHAIMSWHSTVSLGDNHTVPEAIRACQAQCAAAEECAHFTVLFPGRSCELSSEGATKASHVLGAVSGPRSCAAPGALAGQVRAAAAVREFDAARSDGATPTSAAWRVLRAMGSQWVASGALVCAAALVSTAMRRLQPPGRIARHHGYAALANPVAGEEDV